MSNISQTLFELITNPFFLLLIIIAIFAIGYHVSKKYILLSLFKGYLSVAIQIIAFEVSGRISRTLFPRSNFTSAGDFIPTMITAILISACFMFLIFIVLGCSAKASIFLCLFSPFIYFGLPFGYVQLFLREIPGVYERISSEYPNDLDLTFQGIILAIVLVGAVCTAFFHKYYSERYSPSGFEVAS